MYKVGKQTVRSAGNLTRCSSPTRLPAIPSIISQFQMDTALLVALMPFMADAVVLQR